MVAPRAGTAQGSEQTTPYRLSMVGVLDSPLLCRTRVSAPVAPGGPDKTRSAFSSLYPESAEP